jgi:hypothetical protein
MICIARNCSARANAELGKCRSPAKNKSNGLYQIEAFNRDAVSGSYSVDQLLHRAVDYISDALSMEGVLLFDAISAGQGKPREWRGQVGIFILSLSQLRVNSISGRIGTAFRCQY